MKNDDKYIIHRYKNGYWCQYNGDDFSIKGVGTYGNTEIEAAVNLGKILEGINQMHLSTKPISFLKMDNELQVPAPDQIVGNDL